MKTLLFFCIFWFGPDEHIYPLQEVKGTNHVLCHKVRVFYILLGTGVHDDGYVLQTKSEKSNIPVIDRTYLPVTESELKTYQDNGQLPTPLPVYSISLKDYFWGNSLWIALGLLTMGLVAYILLEYQTRKSKINLRCACGRTLSLENSFAGRMVRCSQCKATIKVPLFAPNISKSANAFKQERCPNCEQLVRFPAITAVLIVSCPRCSHRWDCQ